MATELLVEDPNDPGIFIIQSTIWIEDPDDPGTFIIQNNAIIEDDTDPGTFLKVVISNPRQITWNNPGERLYEVGLDRGVLYVEGEDGVPWNGLISVNEKAKGGETKAYYVDGVKYYEDSSPEEFLASIEAYTYPDLFGECDGTESVATGLFVTQQERKKFGLAYRTRIGNDIEGYTHGYKIHLVYNALAKPTSRDYKTIDDKMDALTFTWDITTTPRKMVNQAAIGFTPGVRYGAHLIIDSRIAYPWAIEALEKVLYGSDTTAPKLPSPQEVLDIFVDNALLQITVNDDGTWTADGPDSAITMLSETEFQITWDSATFIDANTYTISSL